MFSSDHDHNQETYTRISIDYKIALARLMLLLLRAHKTKEPLLMHYALTNTSGAILCSTLFSLSTHASNLPESCPICSRESTRG